MGTSWGWAQEATVSIEAWTAAEERLPAPRVTLTESGTRKAVGNFRNGRAAGIPYGEYILEVAQPGFKIHEQRISVCQPEVFTRVMLQVANFPDAASLKGVLKPKACPDDWVKLVSIRGNNTPVVETKVRSDGSFELTGFDGGDYLLLLVRGLKVIYSEQLPIYGMRNVEITIPADKPKP